MENRETRIISGKGQYIDDLEFHDMAYLAFVGSPHAHAKILGYDVRKALETPGVLTVITGKEIVELTNPLPVQADLSAQVGRGGLPRYMPLPLRKQGGTASRWQPSLLRMNIPRQKLPT